MKKCLNFSSTIFFFLLVLTSCGRKDCCDPCEVIDETYIHKYGFQVPHDEWDSRGQHGQVVSKLSNGVKVTKDFDHGVLHGDVNFSFPHIDTIEKVKTYSQGDLIREVVFYRSGNPKIETIFHPSGEVVSKEWYESGVPQCVEHYYGKKLQDGKYFTTDNQLEGKIEQGSGEKIHRDRYGLLVSMDTYENGEKIQTTTYHANGVPKESVPFFRGYVEGLRKTYYPGGEPNTVEEWVAGKKHGMFIQFENGERMSEVRYVNGMKNGVERRFRNDNEVVEEITWLNNLVHGPRTAYYGENRQAIKWFFQGKPVSKRIYEKMAKTS